MEHKGWGLFQDGQDIHVIPICDRQEHRISPNCPCSPDPEVIGANIKYLHHSWDGREYIEQAEYMLGIENEEE